MDIKAFIKRGFVNADFGRNADYTITSVVFRILQVAIEAKISIGMTHESILDWLTRVIRKAEVHMEHVRAFSLRGIFVTDAIDLVNRIDHDVFMRIIINEDDDDDEDDGDNNYNSDDDDDYNSDDDDDNSDYDDDSSDSDYYDNSDNYNSDSDSDDDSEDNFKDNDVNNNVTDDTNYDKCDVVVINNEVTIETSKSLDVQIENLKTELPIKDEKIKALKELIELEELQRQARMKDEEIKELEELLATERDADANNVRKRKRTMSDSEGTSEGRDKNSDPNILTNNTHISIDPSAQKRESYIYTVYDMMYYSSEV